MAAEKARLVIADTGHGLKPEAKDRIFEPYYSTKKGGTGLGLTIARLIGAKLPERKIDGLDIYDAIERFDFENGASFLAFAEWRMRGAISEAMHSDAKQTRAPDCLRM